MTHTAVRTATIAGAKAGRGSLAPKLLALRNEIDVALAVLARELAVQAVPEMDGRTAPRTPLPVHTPVASTEAPADPLEELGVIGFILGLRPDRPRQ